MAINFNERCVAHDIKTTSEKLQPNQKKEEVFLVGYLMLVCGTFYGVVLVQDRTIHELEAVICTENIVFTSTE